MRTLSVTRIWPLLALAALAPSAARSQSARRGFAIEDLYRLKTIADPTVSPDGKTIAYTVATTDYAAAKKTVAIWRMDADGKNARPLTSSDAKDEHPEFSPDGRTLAFVSTRAGDAQLFLLPLDGGEAEKKTDVPGGIENPVFSPDGRKIAFAADAYPDCGADMPCNRKRSEARDKHKLKAHLADSLLYRHWTDWKDGKRAHVFVLDLESGKLRDMTPGDFDSPVFEVGGAANYAFSPDGSELAFSSNRSAFPASSTNADVYTVSVDGDDSSLRTPRNLTAANPGWDSTPRYSPDGRTLAVRRQVTPGYESDRFRIVLLDRATGAAKDLAADFDNTISEFAFSKDGKKIYFTANVKGRTPLHEIDVASGRIRTISAVGLLDTFCVAPGGSWAAVARRRIGSPYEIWRLSLAPGADEAGTRLTFHNEAVEKDVDIRPAEEFTVAGAGGKPVQVWIVKPHGFDPAKKYALILNVHGGPQSQWADSFRGDWQVYPGAGYVVAFPNPHGSTGFGQAYTSAISGDWNGKVIEDIEKVTDALEKLPYVDKDRIGAMGWSWGGYAMMWLEGHSTRYKALASMMGVYDLRSMYSSTEELWFPEWDLKGAPWEQDTLYEKQSPSEFVKTFQTPCLVITGEKDFRVPYTQSLMFFTDLQKMRVPSRLIVFEKAGHWPAWNEMALYYAAHLDWFHRFLGGGASPWDPKDMVANRVTEAAAAKMP